MNKNWIRNQNCRKLALIPLSLCLVLSTTGCSSGPDAATTTRLDALEKEVATLKSSVENLRANAVTPPAQSDVNAIKETASKPASSAPVVATSFNDIAGKFGEKEITELNKLGVLDVAGDKFEPSKPILRREFARWLFKATNAVVEPDRKIRTVESGTSSFKDLPETDPDFPYIQGLANTGIAVGYDDKTFKPDQPLTREEMFAVKGPLDFIVCGYDPIKDCYGGPWRWERSPWLDKDQASKRLWAALDCAYERDDSTPKCITNVIGTTKLFKPKQTVTRGEAAVSMSAIGGGHSKMYLTSEAVEKLAK